MAEAQQIALYDAVCCAWHGKWIAGHLAKKSGRTATVVTADGQEYRVPWSLLAPLNGVPPQRVETANDRLKARFRPEDEVSFDHRSAVRRGVIARLGPVRAHVVCDDDLEFRVPYAKLRGTARAAERRDRRRLGTIARYAERLMASHGLTGWSLQYDDASRRAGSCNPRLKVIGLSRLYCLHASPEEVRETILHEIAHALVGPGHGHDSVWKAAARALGCTGDRCHYVEFAPPRYLVSCPRCGWTEHANTRHTDTICKTCRTPVTYRTFTRRAWEQAHSRSSGGAVTTWLGEVRPGTTRSPS